MYALLDFGKLRIEQRTKFSQVKSYYKGEIVDGYKQYCDKMYINSIDNFFKGIIEESAFGCCCSLINIEIPDSVTSIGDCAFFNCTNLTSINVDENNENYCSIDGVLFSKDMTTLVAYPAGKTDSAYTISEGVTSIEDGVFYNCTSLASVTIPNSVTSIGDCAFYAVPHIYYSGTATGSPWNALAIN